MQKENKIKITIIGGSGFVGTNLCDRLSKNGNFEFEIIDIKKSKRYPDLCKLADVRDIDSLRRKITGNIVINLAAVHRDDVKDTLSYQLTNVDGAANIATVSTEKGIKKIIFTSSVAVYGYAKHGTDETGRIEPYNDYGKSKYAAEMKFVDWAQSEKNNLMIIRPTVIFGEGNRGNVFNLLNQIASNKFIMIGNGTNIKSMAYVGNFVAFLENCITENINFGIYNYVDTPDMTVNDIVKFARFKIKGKNNVGARLPKWFGLMLAKLADLFSKITGIKLPISTIRVNKFTTSSSFTASISELGGFTREFTLAEGLERTIEREFIFLDENREVFHTE